MPTRRLDDRIRMLLGRAAHASSGELETVLQELLSAIHEKIERLRELAAKQLLGGKHHRERRAKRS